MTKIETTIARLIGEHANMVAVSDIVEVFKKEKEKAKAYRQGFWDGFENREEKKEYAYETN